MDTKKYISDNLDQASEPTKSSNKLYIFDFTIKHPFKLSSLILLISLGKSSQISINTFGKAQSIIPALFFTIIFVVPSICFFYYSIYLIIYLIKSSYSIIKAKNINMAFDILVSKISIFYLYIIIILSAVIVIDFTKSIIFFDTKNYKLIFSFISIFLFKLFQLKNSSKSYNNTVIFSELSLTIFWLIASFFGIISLIQPFFITHLRIF